MRTFLAATIPLVYLSGAFAQSQQAFEVAAIHRNLSGGQNTNIKILDGGRLSITNASVKTLIRNAYGILSFQLANEPPWIDTDMYDIEAKTGNPDRIAEDELKPLLQNLLAERFHLRVHRETREGTVYALYVDKSGPKFKEHPGPPENGMNTSKHPGKARMTGTAASMAILTSNLGNQLGRFAVDETGLNGGFDFTLEWDPDQSSDSTGPSIFTSLREQLGLRLESRKGAIEMLVIDGVEKASEN
jgi:uncharacterized protein (TIGR03435 family)